MLASALRKEHWKLQQSAGIDFIPSNDFLCTIRFSMRWF